MRTAGSPESLPRTRSAAAATSSAIAITEAVIARPSRSGCSRQSASGASPAHPIATSTWPWRHGRPHESVTITAPAPRRSRRAAAERSGASGSRTTVSGAPALERSTPAFAQMNPWRGGPVRGGGAGRAGVGAVHAGVRADEPMAGAADEAAAVGAQQLDRLVEDDLDVARVLVVLRGQRAGAVARLDGRQRAHEPLGLGDDLVGDREH